MKGQARWATKGAAVIVPALVFVVAKTLASFAAIIQDHLAIRYDLRFELGMVIGQVLFQWLWLLRHTWQGRLDYAVRLVAVSALGAVLLWPLLLLNHLAPVTVPVAVGYFFAVVAVMFAVHWQLVVAAKLPKYLCATWVLYRLLILAVVLKRS